MRPTSWWRTCWRGMPRKASGRSSKNELQAGKIVNPVRPLHARRGHDGDMIGGCVRAKSSKHESKGPLMFPVRLTFIAVALAATTTVVLAQGTPQQRAACRPDVA